MSTTVKDLPPVSDDLATFLSEAYPAKCWNPTEQDEWQHHRYAGMHALAQALIARNQLDKDALGLDPGAVKASEQ